MNRKKLAWDSKFLDWAYWANLHSISAKDACWLVCGVDPNICNSDSVESEYSLSDEKKIEIQRAITQIEADIRREKEKEYNSPWDWVCWAESRGIPVPKQFHQLAFKAKVESIHVISPQRLEEISKKLLVWYMKQDSWTYYEAIFLIRGFKPPGDIEGFDEVRTHFGNEYLMLERSIEIGTIGKKVNRAGQVTYIDTPERWIAWAKKKGYNSDHLDSLIDTQEINSATDSLQDSNKTTNGSIPGKIPKISIGRCAVIEAWELERETGTRATAKEVLKMLQVWAENGKKYSEVLLRKPEGDRGMVVYWLTSKSSRKAFLLTACEKTLAKWNKSRQ